MATAGSIVVDLLMRTGAFETDTARAEKLMKQRMKGIETAVNNAAATVSVAAVAIAGGMALWVKQAADAADQLDQLSERTGVTVETLNGLSYATRMSGGDIGELEKGLQSLNKRLSEAAAGNKSASELLKALGVSAGTADEALMQLADVFPELSKQDQVRVGTELLGKSYAALVPLLAQGRAGLQGMIEEGQRLNPITAETAKQAALLNDNMDRLKILSDGVAVVVGNSLIPGINRLAAEFLDAQRAGLTFGEMLNNIWRTTPLDAGQRVRELGDEIAATQQKLASLPANGWAVSVDREKLEGDIKALERQREYFKARQREAALALGDGAYSNEGRGMSRSSEIVLPREDKIKTPKATKDTYTDPLAESAKLYASALEAIDKAQLSAQTSGIELTATQQRLMELFSDPAFLAMPDTWKTTIVSAAESAIAIEEAAKKTEEYNKQTERLNELIGEAKLQQQISDMNLLSEAFNNGRISVEQFEEGIRSAFGLDDEEGGYWQKWLEGAEESLTSFDELAGSVVDNTSSKFGDFFEQMVFDAGDAGEAASMMAEGMARSVINALGQMAAQWLAYQAVQMLVGESTQKSGAGAMAANAAATSLQAGIAAFASTAAIPIVGPGLAPEAMTAAISATAPIAASIAALGAMASGARADGGPVSANAPYLIGERGPELFVPNTAGKVLPNSALGGAGSPTINLIEDKRRAGQTQERTGANGKQEIDIFVADLMGDGPRAKAIARRFGLTAKGY